MTSTSVATAAQKLLKVAIVGLPNAGKSTLINNLVDTLVCPVSKRVHTTRVNQQIAYIHQDTQIVFVDTPGLVNVKEIKKFGFPKDFIFGPEQSVKMADVVGVIHDLSNGVTRNKLDPRIRGLLEKFQDQNSILILNKVDTIRHKQTLLDTVRILTSGVVDGRTIQMKKAHTLKVKEERKFLEMDSVLERAKARAQGGGRTQFDVDIDQKTQDAVVSAFLEEEIKEGLHLHGWPKFRDVFIISALHNDGVHLIRDYFLANAKLASWMFDQDFLTDVDPRNLTVRMVKALLLDHLPQEMPYKLSPVVEFWETNESGVLRVIIGLECPNDRFVGRVVGTGGTLTQKLTQAVESMLSNLLRVPVSLAFNVYTKAS